MTDNTYIRKPKNIYIQFWPYLFSNFCISVALALNEFLNGVLVSNMLGGQALAVLNLTIPLTMVAASVYTLCGYGPSVALGNVLGRSHVEEADRIFTMSFILLVIMGVVLSAAGIVFRNAIAIQLVGGSGDFPPDVARMVGVMSAGGLFLLFIPYISYFIKMEGKPGYAVLLMTLANILNVSLTALFIIAFDMGVEAAAFSVVIGYIVSTVLFIALVYYRKIPFRLTRIGTRDFKDLCPILATGLPATISLLLMALQINVMNRLSFLSAGIDGVVIFSVCLGAYSLAGMFYQGVTDTLVPILSVLRGARDINGQYFIIKRIFFASAILSAGTLIIFGAFPQLMMELYGVEPRLRIDTADSIRIFTVGMSLLVFVLFFLDYLQCIGRKAFAMLLSVLKNVVCVLPLAWLFSSFLGIRGTMLGFSAGMALSVIAIMIHNMIVCKRSGGRLRGFLLLPTKDDREHFEATMPINEKAAAELSEKVAGYCADCNVDKKTSYILSLAVEELAMFTVSNHKNAKRDSIDVFLTIAGNEATLVFCVTGKPFNVFDYGESSSCNEEITNMMMLKKISNSITFERILLMNRTIINFNI